MRTFGLIVLGLLIIWFLYLARAILTPFILAAIFAYILNPVINTLSEKTKFHRVYFIVLLYVLLFSLIGWVGTFFTRQIFAELRELGGESQILLRNAEGFITTLPFWAQGYARDALVSLREALTIEPTSILPIFSGAASRFFATITFLFGSFYFLKDGARLVESILLFFPGEHKLEAEILLRRINVILGNYLRGQLMLVLLMATLGFIIFSFLGVRFSLLLGLLIGLAEIVPMIGPIIAGVVVAVVGMFDGLSRFGLPPLYDGLVIVGAYIVLNQIENYIIVPQLMGRITNLHPLLIFFAVLAGGHLFGILGFILAVPVAASLRIVFEFWLDKLTSK